MGTDAGTAGEMHAGGTEGDGRGNRTGEAGGPAGGGLVREGALDATLEGALANLRAHNPTAQGVVDVSAAAGTAELVQFTGWGALSQAFDDICPTFTATFRTSRQRQPSEI